MKRHISIGRIIIALCATLMITTSASAQEVRRLARDTTALAPLLQQSEKKTLQNRSPRAITTTPIMQQAIPIRMQRETLKTTQPKKGTLHEMNPQKTPDASPENRTTMKPRRYVSRRNAPSSINRILRYVSRKNARIR